MADQFRKSVLLVEDNPADVFVVREVLRECNLDSDVHIARDGHEAMLYLKSLLMETEHCPALVLLDLNLPKVGGLEVLSYIRNSSPCKNTPVIIVTSSNAMKDREITGALGVQAYFQKPTSLDQYMELAKVIRQVLGELAATSPAATDD
jgi:CheY-like chemotaxis protein